jgi:hypothetical protein
MPMRWGGPNNAESATPSPPDSVTVSTRGRASSHHGRFIVIGASAGAVHTSNNGSQPFPPYWPAASVRLAMASSQKVPGK